MNGEPPRQIKDATSRLRLDVRAAFVPFFFPILQQGFAQQVRTGGSVRELLSGRFGLPDDYIEKRIQTIFLNGKPIDDLHTAVVRDGSVLALSSAMPGVLGATLRRGGFYAGMRNGITHEEETDTPAAAEGRITVKLFNLTIRELGPLFLEKGIELSAEEMKDFLRNPPAGWRDGCMAAEADGEAIDPASVPVRDFPAGYVRLELRIV